MNIPDQAVEAAARALNNERRGRVALSPLDRLPWSPTADEAREDATAALEAALPYLEAALRKQIATDIRTKGEWVAHMHYAEGREDAARIAEEGNTK